MMDFQILVDDAHLSTSGDIIQEASASPERFLSLELCLCTSLNWLFFSDDCNDFTFPEYTFM